MSPDQSGNRATSNAEQDILRTDPEQRRKVQRLIIIMVIAALLFWWLGLPALDRWMDVNDTAVTAHRMGLVCYGLSVLLLATAAYAGWFARRIFRSSEFPPPGTWVLRDTRILRGQQARARGWWVVACAISFLVLAAYATTLPHRFEELLKASAQPQISIPAPVPPKHG